MTPKEISQIIQEKFFEETKLNYPWFVIGENFRNNTEQHFVLFCEAKNCYCKVTLHNNKIVYLKFHC